MALSALLSPGSQARSMIDLSSRPEIDVKRHRRQSLIVSVAGLVVAGLLATGCTTSRHTRGYVLDEELVGVIAPGVDNRLSVRDTLGSPSTTSAFGDETWYYISRQTIVKGFLEEETLSQTVVAIEFDDGGTVADVKRYDLADAREISPRADETPIRGKTLGFFEQLLRGIGRVGPGGPGGPGGSGRPPGT